jgi:hypothetical protein
MRDKNKVYLAGPMSDMKFANAPAFAAFKTLWAAVGWDVVTPIELNSRVWERQYGVPFDPYTMDIQYGHPVLPEMFAEDIKTILCDVDAIAVLPGWQHSKGVARELAVATLFNKDIYDALTFKPLKLDCWLSFGVDVPTTISN